MTKTTTDTYVAYSQLGAGGVWGSAVAQWKAIKNLIKEAHEYADALGGFSPEAQVRVVVVRIPAGQYWRYDPMKGHMACDYDTDKDVSYAVPVDLLDWDAGKDPEGVKMVSAVHDFAKWKSAVEAHEAKSS